jgi:hypothetical protein
MDTRNEVFMDSIRLLAILLGVAAAGTAGADFIRLGHDVVPTFQSIELTVDADQPSYRGTVRFELEAARSAEHFRFHSEGLELERVVLTGAGGPIEIDHRPEGDDVVRVTPAAPLAPGRYVLEVAFANAFDTRATSLPRALVRSYLTDGSVIDPSLAVTLLRLAALEGDAALFDEYRRRFESAEVPQERERFLWSMGYFEDPDLHARVLRYALAGPLRPTELSALLSSWLSSASRDRAFRFVTDHYATITERIPPSYAAYMPRFADGCSLERLEHAKRFFADPAHQIAGAERQLAKLAEEVTDCAGLRAREGAAVADYLRGVAGGS